MNTIPCGRGILRLTTRSTLPPHTYQRAHPAHSCLSQTLPNRALSTTTPMRTAHGKHKEEVSIPRANFSDLGASRTVKIVVVVALSTAATAETVTYVKLGMGWWRGRNSAEGEGRLEE
ncbi:hypothetical protein CAC42_7608 [Sphaceloma murrayae]|uniref:Uncharacterized protein n=1 Tax=Sphaceloma murrayae TaxID=2082308 RepID=A0A2K1QTA6_9PEZI|nr:hypothetical protein CAC42_7608 [Sphaceloma murrayae]